MAYKLVTLDLSIVALRQELVGAGNALRGVTVMQLPAGAACSVALGQSANVPLIAVGQQWADIDCSPDDANNGLFFSNPAAGAGTVILYVDFSASGTGSGATLSIGA